MLPASSDSRTLASYSRHEAIYTQGDVSGNVLYIQAGGVKLTVVSKNGKEAVVAMLGPGAFFGEGCLAGEAVRMGSATALTPSLIVRLPKARMMRLLHRQRAMSDRFITHVLSRSVTIEKDLLDQLFDTTEKRLAHTLLKLAKYGEQDTPLTEVPWMSPHALAKMIGTTRPRVTVLLDKFKRLGFIASAGRTPVEVNPTLLSVVLHD